MSLQVEVRRGAIVESVHAVHVAVVNADGELLAAAGDPALCTYWRSAAKPVQLLPLLEAGGAERFGLTEAEIALMAASHSGEDVHVRTVANILQKVGCGPEALRCGAHPPLHEPTATRLQRAGEPPTPLHSNCSGKHAGFLALCRLLGADPEAYLDPDHPVQQRVRQAVGLVTGVPEERLVIGVDGCGVPTFGLPLMAMARAYARLADPSALPARWGSAARRVTAAMRQHPEMVGGSDRFDTELMRAAGDRLFCKGGAEGVHCIGLVAAAGKLKAGTGIACKVADGSGRAVAPAVSRVLRDLGILGPAEWERLKQRAQPPVKNHSGRCVGEIAATPFVGREGPR